MISIKSGLKELTAGRNNEKTYLHLIYDADTHLLSTTYIRNILSEISFG